MELTEVVSLSGSALSPFDADPWDPPEPFAANVGSPQNAPDAQCVSHCDAPTRRRPGRVHTKNPRLAVPFLKAE